MIMQTELANPNDERSKINLQIELPNIKNEIPTMKLQFDTPNNGRNFEHQFENRIAKMRSWIFKIEFAKRIVEISEMKYQK